MTVAKTATEGFIAAFRAELLQRGFDLLAPLAVSDELPVDPALERFGRKSALGFVVGNTRALWHHFSPNRVAGSANPLDTYTEHALHESLDAAAELVQVPRERAVYFSHQRSAVGGAASTSSETRSGAGPIPIQRLAHAAGLAALAPCHLCVHPVFGPWIALRAVVVVPLPPPGPVRPLDRPCRDCSAPCVPALATAQQGPSSPGEPPSVRWLAVRDACPVGREHRYGSEQVAFHYAVLDNNS